MTLRNLEVTERFAFTDAESLAKFLNQYSPANLATLYVENEEGDAVTLYCVTETLSDGSKVHNLRFV